MLTLALDTSTAYCSACIYESDADIVLASISQDIGRGHAEALIDIIDQCLMEAKRTYKDFDRVITSTGPGSFTGARVCVSAARGFALSLQIPAIGISNFDAYSAFAHRQGATKFATLMNAGRGEYFAQFSFDSEFAKADEPFIAKADALAASNSLIDKDVQLAGSDAEAIAAALDLANPILDISNFNLVEEIAKLGAIAPEQSTRPQPLYLRSADAKPQHGFAVERVS